MGQIGLLEILPYIYTVNDQLVAMATITYSVRKSLQLLSEGDYYLLRSQL